MDKNEASKLFRKPKQQSHQARHDSSAEKVRINNLIELKNLIKRLKPDSKSDKTGPIIIDTKAVGMADESYSGSVVIPQSGGQSTLRQTILDGFEMIKNHKEYHKASLATQATLDAYGGFPPAVVPNPEDHLTWIDIYIDRNMGGRREGLTIIWELPEGKFKLDPWTCELEKVDSS